MTGEAAIGSGFVLGMNLGGHDPTHRTGIHVPSGYRSQQVSLTSPDTPPAMNNNGLWQVS